MNEKIPIQCSYCQQAKENLCCTTCTFEKLKDIRLNNEIKANEFGQSFSSIPKTSFTENIQLLRMIGKGQTAKNTHLLNKLNTEKGTLQNYLKIIQERKKIVQAQVNQIKEYNTQLHKDVETLKKEKGEKEKQNFELKKQKLITIQQIYNKHYMFPNLEVPLRLKIVQDKFVEATQTGFIESQHFSLDISGNFSGLSFENNIVFQGLAI